MSTTVPSFVGAGGRRLAVCSAWLRWWGRPAQWPRSAAIPKAAASSAAANPEMVGAIASLPCWGARRGALHRPASARRRPPASCAPSGPRPRTGRPGPRASGPPRRRADGATPRQGVAVAGARPPCRRVHRCQPASTRSIVASPVCRMGPPRTTPRGPWPRTGHAHGALSDPKVRRDRQHAGVGSQLVRQAAMHAKGRGLRMAVRGLRRPRSVLRQGMRLRPDAGRT